jgi:hypothetical protein
MIVAKKKLCSICGEYKILWKSFPPTCNSCKPKTPIKKVSNKHKETLKEYKFLREEFLKEHPNCQLKLQGCTFVATTVEHRMGKSHKELYLDSSKWFASCLNCNQQIENLGKLAYEKGLKIHKNQINES